MILIGKGTVITRDPQDPLIQGGGVLLDGKTIREVGPAGIACASFLARAGAQVRVFDRSSGPGGTVRHVIPDFRISSEAVLKTVQRYTTWMD